MTFKIENPFANANKPRTIRFTDELFDKLEKTARDNDVSFNMLVLQCCRYALNSMENEGQSD